MTIIVNFSGTEKQYKRKNFPTVIQHNYIYIYIYIYICLYMCVCTYLYAVMYETACG